MLNCFYDAMISEDSKCAKCCIYCDEKDVCELKCYGIDVWKTEAEIAKKTV